MVISEHIIATQLKIEQYATIIRNVFNIIIIYSKKEIFKLPNKGIPINNVIEI